MGHCQEQLESSSSFLPLIIKVIKTREPLMAIAITNHLFGEKVRRVSELRILPRREVGESQELSQEEIKRLWSSERRLDRFLLSFLLVVRPNHALQTGKLTKFDAKGIIMKWFPITHIKHIHQGRRRCPIENEIFGLCEVLLLPLLRKAESSQGKQKPTEQEERSLLLFRMFTIVVQENNKDFPPHSRSDGCERKRLQSGSGEVPVVLKHSSLALSLKRLAWDQGVEEVQEETQSRLVRFG
jgi:hypothetical protein